MDAYKYKLKIFLADTSADVVFNMYQTNAVLDIDQTAWNLCQSDDEIQKKRFSELQLADWKVKKTNSGEIELEAVFTVKAESKAFVREVIEDYLDGISDYIAETENGLYSRTGERTRIDFSSLKWELEITSL